MQLKGLWGREVGDRPGKEMLTKTHGGQASLRLKHLPLRLPQAQ